MRTLSKFYKAESAVDLIYQLKQDLQGLELKLPENLEDINYPAVFESSIKTTWVHDDVYPAVVKLYYETPRG